MSHRDNPIELLYEARDTVHAIQSQARAVPTAQLQRDLASYDAAITSTLDGLYTLLQLLTEQTDLASSEYPEGSSAIDHFRLAKLQEALRLAVVAAHHNNVDDGPE